MLGVGIPLHTPCSLWLRCQCQNLPCCPPHLCYRIVAEAMQTLDYHTDRFGTIAHSVQTTGLAYSGFSKGVERG